jgi:protein-S-isoprenylcysteine O-methyltransferase
MDRRAGETGQPRPPPASPVPPSFSHERGLGAVALRAAALGAAFGSHALLLAYATRVAPNAALAQWAAYVMALSAFHFLEFALTALHRPGEVGADSFLLNHSVAYGAAFAAAVAEFWLEYRFAPRLKGRAVVSAIGLALVLGGQAVRSAAMHTAGSNFTHLVAQRKRPEHQLVTHGVYALLRHPSYFGWFWWSVGTQVLLGNPVCAVGYALASWRFFADRIPFEEFTLCDFFGAEYVAYARRTFIGIPFVKQFAGLAAPLPADAGGGGRAAGPHGE